MGCRVRWLCVLLPLVAGCSRPAPPAPPVAKVAEPGPAGAAGDGPNVQNLTPAEIEEFYHRPEGSELYPLAWVKALRDPSTKKPFLDNIERFGMLPDPGENDRDGLPIGVSRGPSRGLEFLGPMIGVNCAACHVAQLTYKGESLTLIGGPSMISLDRFYGDLFASAGAMVADPAELAAFYGRLAKSSGAADKTQPLLALLAGLAGKPAPALEPAEAALKGHFTKLLTKVHNDIHAGIDTISPPRADGALRKKLSADNQKLIDALLGAAADPRLAGKGRPADRDELQAAIEGLVTNAALMKGRLHFLQKIKTLHDTAGTTPGPGRSDAFGIISNMVLPAANIPLTAPVSYPAIWSLGPPYEMAWFHYNGNTNSLLQRNVGQAIGLGAAFNDTFASTIRIRDMDRLQKITRKLRPPPWPARLLGPIDAKAAARGKEHFAAKCGSCHADPREANHAKRELYVDYTKVGTDPQRIDNFQIDVNGVPYIKALAGAAAKLTDKAYDDAGVTPAEQKQFEPVPAVWVAKPAYMARPLIAAWATAPYLHNGSVPTLYHLLQPVAKRPRFFTVGNREYDPARLGYVFQEVDGADAPVAPPLWVFDTTRAGNHNTGHEYGIDLDEMQKAELLEYLKGN